MGGKFGLISSRMNDLEPTRLAKLPISSLFLGIDTDDSIAYLQELLSHTTNVVKLAVAVGMHCARQALAVGDQAKAQLAQQPTDCGATDPVCLCAQPRCNRAQA